ncbi:MAG: TlpA family protein disulfide reductase [Bacteroidales bacterium]|jgi:thiol-disulfide isomerase/thioredoxin|nr:TlpA family protein disulfide reductase [Bacteroidales bacterium]
MRNIALLGLLALSMTVQAQIPATLTGNWINMDTGNWEYGFFEQFAIHDCAFWEYAAGQTKGKTSKIVLQKDGKTLTLNVKQKNDSVISIKNGRLKSDFLLMRKLIPDYKTADATPFPEPKFRRDSATLIGYYRNFDKIPDNFMERYGKNYIEIGKEESDGITRATIDSLGRFAITFPLVNTQQLHVDIRRLGRKVVFSPNDTIFVFADVNDLIWDYMKEDYYAYILRDKQIIFMGDNARLNNELLQYTEAKISVPLSSDSPEQKTERTDIEYLDYCKNIYAQRLAHLDNYMATHMVSEKFRLLETETERYRFAYSLLCVSRRHNKRWQPFDTEYMNYIKSEIPLYKPELYTLFDDFMDFFDNFITCSSGQKSVSYGTDTIGDVMEEENIITPEIRDAVVRYRKLMEQFVSEAADTLKKKKTYEKMLAVAVELSNNKEFRKVNDNYVRNMFFKLELAAADSLIQEPHLKEMWTARQYADMFESNRVPLFFREEKAEFDRRITNPLYREPLLATNKYYQELENRTLAEESSLKNTDSLAGIEDAEELLKKLTEPYLGKVIYLDFWGTWCGPCRENMKLMGNIEEHFKDKDVIFMYLANNSPGTTWESVIKEMNLLGNNIVHYRLPGAQQAMIERHLKVNMFPSYFIIGRDGKIVNSAAPSPKYPAQLNSELEKWLEK